MKSDEQLAEYIRARPGITVEAICNNLRKQGVNAEQARRVLATMSGGPIIPVPVTPKPGAKPLKGLLEEFDDLGKVRKALKALPKAEYLEDDELRRTLKIADHRWREVRSHPQLATFVFMLPNKKVVWMHQEAQQSLKAALDLSAR